MTTTQHFDIIVVGAGPAGLAAACATGRSGVRVAVLDDNPSAGGQIWRQGAGHPRSAPLGHRLAELAALSNVKQFVSTRVIAPLGTHGLLLESAQPGGMTVTYAKLILATGARERLLPFAGWTLPGVTGAGGLQALIKGGMPVQGERVLIAGSGPLLLATLATVRAAGAHVLAVVEQAPAKSIARFGASLIGTPSKLIQASRLTQGFSLRDYWTRSVVREVRGDGRVEQVVVLRGDREVMLDCDRVAIGYGLVPNVSLALALGCEVNSVGAIAVDDRQRTTLPDVLAAGECTGVGGMELAQIEGEISGLVASGSAASLTSLAAGRARWRSFSERVEAAFSLGNVARTLPPEETLLCRCEDVPIGDVARHASWREAKLQTRCGMGACQGRICGTACNTFFSWDTGTPRPPIHPARIGTLMAAHPEHAPTE
ncbi:FAD-dependent oxidoreductase [Ralstonia syzygii]|uniref:FAD-dependent pyridine nucleotide-disulphide oxidoreductase n=2 Tax=Ralstonia syzygii TaxID=28097 RepID=G2ZZB6_9RALS|nr:FAD-dependent oxidoreductase [Ralstonia syzygii]CCA84215.1 FAD-dependent pyridine nucleotide-disulphide oxidoreductase [Ralstonia syzygii R24]